MHSTTISEGKMIINNQSTDSCIVTKNIRFPVSFDAEAECTWISGETNKGFGMIIGNDPITCLKFTITANGYFSVFRWLGKNGLKWFSPIVYGWTKTDLIDTSPNAKNVISIQKTDWYMHNVGMIAFYINGTLVARNIFYISPPAGGSGTQFSKDGVIGLFSYGNLNSIILMNIKMSGLLK
ncbi:MAG: hypothetical protein IPN68_18155 [Bacteroidetes bacterium]|nr:hypothetical protein [Bacteroidota bacterium]